MKLGTISSISFSSVARRAVHESFGTNAAFCCLFITNAGLSTRMVEHVTFEAASRSEMMLHKVTFRESKPKDFWATMKSQGLLELWEKFPRRCRTTDLGKMAVLSRQQIYRLAKEGKIPGRKTTKGRHNYFVKCPALMRWISQKRNKTSQAKRGETPPVWDADEKWKDLSAELLWMDNHHPINDMPADIIAQVKRNLAPVLLHLFPRPARG